MLSLCTSCVEYNELKCTGWIVEGNTLVFCSSSIDECLSLEEAINDVGQSDQLVKLYSCSEKKVEK